MLESENTPPYFTTELASLQFRERSGNQVYELPPIEDDDGDDITIELIGRDENVELEESEIRINVNE